MELNSSAFKEGGPIPARYTCDGRDVSPPLKWGAVPAGAKFLALIADDPDAPGASKTNLEAAMEGHVLAQAQLMGTYQRR